MPLSGLPRIIPARRPRESISGPPVHPSSIAWSVRSRFSNDTRNVPDCPLAVTFPRCSETGRYWTTSSSWWIGLADRPGGLRRRGRRRSGLERRNIRYRRLEQPHAGRQVVPDDRGGVLPIHEGTDLHQALVGSDQDA